MAQSNSVPGASKRYQVHLCGVSKQVRPKPWAHMDARVMLAQSRARRSFGSCCAGHWPPVMSQLLPWELGSQKIRPSQFF